LTSTAIIRPSPAPVKNRAPVCASPGQYARPRRDMSVFENFHRTLAVSGSRAKMLAPAVTYITPSMTSGVTCIPPAPVSNVHARVSIATFCGEICVSGENRRAPGS
jgi:hypothetical protein